MTARYFFFALVLVVTSLSFKAQSKYEYALIEFNYYLKNEIQISVDGKNYLEEKADFSPVKKTANNANPILKKITEYEERGWELLKLDIQANHGSGYNVYFAFLRKKK